MDDLQVLVKAIIDESSVSSLSSRLSELSKSLSSTQEIKLKVGLDQSSVSSARSQLQSIAKQISSSMGSQSGAQLRVFSTEQLQADGQRYFLTVKDIVSRAQQEFGKLGAVNVSNVFKNAKGEIQGFSASVTKADGVVEKFNFNLAKIQNGSRTLSGFVQSNSILTDRNAGTNLEQTLNYLDRIDNKIANITSKTLSSSAKPLLGDMEQFNQYNTRLEQVKGRISEISSSATTLSSSHKREIDSMVADLQRYAAELQSSAYAGTDLKANTFVNQKAELQASLENNIQKWTNSGLFGGEFKASAMEAKTLLSEATNPTDLDAYLHKLKLLNEAFKGLGLSAKQSNDTIAKDTLDINIQKSQQRIQNLKSTYSSFANDPQLTQQWEKLFDESKIVSSSKELTNLNAKIGLFEQQLIGAGKHSRSMFDELKNNAGKMANWMILGGVIAAIMRGVTGLHGAVVDLDTAMVELRKVTDETNESYNRFLLSAAKNSVAIGTSYSDFVTSAADFARLGYSMNEASGLAKVANIYNVVGDEVNGIGNATSSIISTMKAFGVEADAAISIVDKFNAVGNNFAISSGGIGEAMMRSASAFAEANNTIDESIALIVAANNVIQNPEIVGTMWKTVSMRIRGAKAELEEAGLETEFMATSVSALRDSINGLTNIDGSGGFDIMLDDDTFKSTYDIILGISEIWKEMNDIDQAALLELLAGKRQGNALAAAINNMDDAINVVQTSVNAEGSALAEHSKWMDSVQAKQQQFTAQYQVFANTLLNSDLIKGTFDTGTGFLGFLTEAVELLGALPILMAAITPFTNMEAFKTVDADNFAGLSLVRAKTARGLEIDADIALLEDYTEKVAGIGVTVSEVGARQQIWNDTIGRGSDSLKSAVQYTNETTISTQQYGMAAVGASAKTAGLGVASKAAAVGVNMLKTALNMLIGLGIGLAISAVVSGISKLANKTKESNQASLEAAKAAATHSAELTELINSYLALSAAVSDGTASKEDFISKQREIIESFGIEIGEIDALIAKYGDLNNAILQISLTKLQEDYRDISKGVDVEKGNVLDVGKSGFFGNQNVINAKGDDAIQAFKILEAAGLVSKNNYTANSGIISLPGYLDIGTFGNAKNIDGVLENYEYISKAMQALENSGIEYLDSNPVYERLSERYNELSSTVKAYTDAVDIGNKNLAEQAVLMETIDGNIPKSLDEFKAYRDGIIEATEQNASFKLGGNSAGSIVDSVLSQNPQYSEFMNELFAQQTALSEFRQKQSVLLSTLVPRADNVIDFATNFGEIKDKIAGLSDEEFEIAYDLVINQGVTTWEDLEGALAQYNKEQEIAALKSNQLQKSISELWNSENFKGAKDELLEIAKSVDGITGENIKELAADSEALSAILNESGMDAQFLAKVLQTMADGGDGLSLITEEALKLNDALFNMSSEFDSVIGAKTRYDNAMAVNEKDTNFKSYAEAFASLNKQFEAGTTNSHAFWAAAEFLFGDEQLATWGWSDGLDNIYASMEKNKFIFEDADSAGAGFIDRLYQMSQAGELLDESGNNLLEISKLADGSYKFDIDTNNLDEISSKMGITKEAVVACLQALSMWGDVNFYDLEEVINTIDEIGLSAESAGKKAINVSDLTTQLDNLGKTKKEIYDTLTALSTLDGVVLFDVTSDVNGLTQSLVGLGLAADDGVTVSVNYEGLADLLVDLGLTKEEAQGLITKLGEADGVTLTNAANEIADVDTALEHLDTLTFGGVTSNIDGIGSAANSTSSNIKNASAEANKLNSQSLSSITGRFGSLQGAAQNTSSAIRNVRLEVESLNGTSATVRINKISSVNEKLASGTTGAKGGPSLVGEKGVELVQSGRYAYLVGTQGAEIVSLNRGDTVFNATDTRRILNSNPSSGRITGAIPAYAFGTVNIGKYTGGAGSSSSGGSSSGSGSGGGSSSAASSDAPWLDELKYYQHLRNMQLITDREYYDKLDEYLARYYDNRESYIDDYRSLLEEAFALARTLADDWFNDMEHKLFLMEKNGVSGYEQIVLYRKMQEEAHRLAEEARAYGLDENSDYIQSLQKQWWDYQDAIIELYNEIYEGEQKVRENTLKLLDNQYNVLKGNRARDSIGINLEEQLEQQLAIQEAAYREAQRLRALGVNENDDAVQSCIDTWWDAYDSIQNINGKIVDNVLGTYDEFIEYADDFDMWSDFDFTKVDYLKTKLSALNKLWEQGVLTLEEYNKLLKEIGVDIYNEQKDALVEIIELTMNLIKRETEDKMDALKAQMDAFKKIINLKKESLATSKEEESYQREVANRVKKIAEIQSKLAQLDRDTSASAQAEKIKLAKELADLQEELADYQADYAYNAQVDALDKEVDVYEDSKNAEIDILKDTIKNSESLYNAAIARIDSDWDQLYKDLIAWNSKYGDMIDGPDSITSAWKAAKSAAADYASVVNALDGIKSEVYNQSDLTNSQSSSPSMPKEDTQSQMDNILAQMKANSSQWKTASASEHKRLEAANEALAAQLSALLGRPVVKDYAAGIWYLDRVGGTRLYHTGLEEGYVGGTPTGSNEVLAVLKEGELVMTEEQYMKLFNTLKYGVYGVLDSLLSRLSNAPRSSSGVIESAVNNNTRNSDNESVSLKNYFYIQGTITEDNMEQFAELYSTHTIEKLNAATRRKGVKNTFGSSILRG